MYYTLQTQPPIKFRLHSIELPKFNLNTPPESLSSEETAIDFAVNSESQVSPEKKYILIATSVEIKKNERVLGSISVSCIYEVENFSEVVTLNEDNIVTEIAKAPLDVLTSIAFSTTRGVMFSEFRGTPLHNILLPIVDPKTLTTKNS